ncbi:hypothetical protein COO60DRAFT_127959 [Scenedesmus sp. NREL 46B-D3]|nr:hypothetical protein COO60DRAFT_127959 [Scenedesmus sp. NREL 46B-D3]
MLLRVLRNACAAGPAAAEVLRTSSVHVHAVQLAAALAQAHARATTVDPQQCKEQQQLLLAALQLLANLCAASAESAAAVWAAFFPDRLQSILAVLQVDVHEVAALTVLYCIRSCSTALADMTSPAAGSIWLHLLAPVLAASSNDTANSSRSTGEPTQHQHQQQHASRIAAPVAAFSTAAPAGDTAGNDNLCLLVKAVALQYDCLQQVLRAVLGRDDAGRGLLQYAAAAAARDRDCSGDCVAQLHSLGLVQLVLGMLQQLGLPPKLREQEQQQQQAAGPPPQPPQQPAPQQQPYAGYRADLIALLSNMLYGRRAIQDELLAAGGVEVLLNNCNLDDTAPLAREWALGRCATCAKTTRQCSSTLPSSRLLRRYNLLSWTAWGRSCSWTERQTS